MGKIINTDNTHVPDILYAFTLQIRHMMFELISLDLNKIVSSEAYEDIAIENGDKITIQQIKSVQSDNNPISNHATALWKTLYNWLNYVKNGTLDIGKTQFHFLVVSNKQLSIGSLAEVMGKATDEVDAENALNLAKVTLWGEKDEKRNTNNENDKYFSVLFDSSNAEIVKKIISSLKICIYPRDYDDNLFKKFCSQTIPPEFAQELFKYMLGWVTEKVNEQIKDARPAFISCKDFHDALVLQTRYYDQKGVLAWTQTQFSFDDSKKELERQDIYIKQLTFIETEFGEKLQASSDYLRTKAQKISWADRGIVAPQSVDDYYSGIERMWKNQKRILDFSSGQPDIQKGRALYAYCQKEVTDLKLHGNEVPEFFGSGSLHTLANEPKIGWHPDYRKLLTIRDTENG